MQASVEAPLVRIVPKIKGIFVNSHVEAVRRQLGRDGVVELARRFGRPVDFRAGEDVAVADEVRLIEHALDLIRLEPVAKEQRAYEAGRLHFQNFSTTPYARLLFALFPRNFRFMMLHASTVAERVFKGVRFEVRETSPNRVEMRMSNADYPIDHFRGLLAAWMSDFGVRGTVRARQLGPYEYLYVMEWDA